MRGSLCQSAEGARHGRVPRTGLPLGGAWPFAPEVGHGTRSASAISAARARFSRLFTVPTEQPEIWAASS